VFISLVFIKIVINLLQKYFRLLKPDHQLKNTSVDLIYIAIKKIFMKKNTFISDLSKKEFPIADKISAKTVRDPIFTLIKMDYPDFDENQFLSITELNMYREKYISNYLSVEINELSNLENKVIGSLKEDVSLVNSVEDEIGFRTFG
jgi:hypothetical protein